MDPNNVYRWNQIPKAVGVVAVILRSNSNIQRMGQTTTSVQEKADINGLVEFINAPTKLDT